MTFLAPGRLSLLVLVAAVAAWYVVSQHRRPAYPVMLSTLQFAVEAQREVGGRWRRHVPAAAYLTLLVLLVVGFARPARVDRVPTRAADLIVALDTSPSMHADDVKPSRLEAAQRAAAGFVQRLPVRTRVGVVRFDGSAELVLMPTSDRARVLRALSLSPPPEGGTAIGDAVAVAAAALVRQRATDAVTGDVPSAPGRRTGPASARVVLLSDGNNTAGRPVEGAAREAAARGVPVDTIAFGTEQGVVVVGRRIMAVPVAHDSLRHLASVTGGRARGADSAAELAEAYSDIAATVGYRNVRRDVSPAVAAVAALLAAVVAAIGLRRAAAAPGRRAARSRSDRAGASRPAS